MTRVWRLALALVAASTVGMTMVVARDWAPESTGTQQNPETTISGLVLDGNTGRPIAGAQVVAGPPGGSRRPATPPPTVTSDGQGRFTFRGMLGGAYRVTATAPGYRPSSARVSSSGSGAARSFQARFVPLLVSR